MIKNKLKALSFKYSTGAMVCLFSKVQDQVNSVVMWPLVNQEPYALSLVYNGLGWPS